MRTTGARHEVKGKKPNAWGLYDMLGNVEEWVENIYDLYFDPSIAIHDIVSKDRGPRTREFSEAAPILAEGQTYGLLRV